MPIIKLKDTESFDAGLRRFKRSCDKAGVIAEVITTTSGASTFVMTPGVIGWNDDGTPATTIYAKVQNLDSVSRTITVTLTLLPLEV